MVHILKKNTNTFVYTLEGVLFVGGEVVTGEDLSSSQICAFAWVSLFETVDFLEGNFLVMTSRAVEFQFLPKRR